MVNIREIVEQFNEDEAVWRCYEAIRKLRRKPGTTLSLPEEVLDHLDWLEAERECREQHYNNRRDP